MIKREGFPKGNSQSVGMKKKAVAKKSGTEGSRKELCPQRQSFTEVQDWELYPGGWQ